jgi:hypothetical protein
MLPRFKLLTPGEKLIFYAVFIMAIQTVTSFILLVAWFTTARTALLYLDQKKKQLLPDMYHARTVIRKIVKF